METLFLDTFDSSISPWDVGTLVANQGDATLGNLVPGALAVAAGQTTVRSVTKQTSGTHRIDFWAKINGTTIGATSSTLFYILPDGAVVSSANSLMTLALDRNTGDTTQFFLAYRKTDGSFENVLTIFRGERFIKISVVLNIATKKVDIYVFDELFIQQVDFPNAAAADFGKLGIINQASSDTAYFDNISVITNYTASGSVVVEHDFVGGSGDIKSATPTTSLRTNHPQTWTTAANTHGTFTLGANGAAPEAAKVCFALQRCCKDGAAEIEFKTSVAGVIYFGMYFRFWDFPSATGAGAGLFRVSGATNTYLLQLPDRTGAMQSVTTGDFTPSANTIYTLKLEMNGRCLVGSIKAAAIDAGSYTQLFVHTVVSSATGGRGMLSEEYVGPAIATTIGAVDNYVRKFRFTGTPPTETAKTIGNG